MISNHTFKFFQIKAQKATGPFGFSKGTLKFCCDLEVYPSIEDLNGVTAFTVNSSNFGYFLANVKFLSIVIKTNNFYG